jgi:hypothetical protein
MQKKILLDTKQCETIYIWKKFTGVCMIRNVLTETNCRYKTTAPGNILQTLLYNMLCCLNYIIYIPYYIGTLHFKKRTNRRLF